jgi:hypothetical protein
VATNDPADPDNTYQFAKPGFYEIRLRAIGPGGSWETQAQRVIHATGAVPVPQPTPVPVPVQPPTPVPSGADVPLPEYFDFINKEGPEVDAAFVQSNLEKALFTSWRRLNENWSHENILRDIRHEPTIDLTQKQRVKDLTYPQWINEEGPAIIAAISSTGHAPTNGDMRHNSWRRFVEKWTLVNIIHDIKHEPLEAPKLVFNGRLRVEGRFWLNDAGIYRPKFASELALCMHTDDEIMARLDDDVNDGFTGFRVFCGNLAWKGQLADHARARIPFIIEQARIRGLYTQPVALTDTKDGPAFDKREHARLLGEICERYDNTILEIANEYYHPSQDDETHDLNYLLRLRREVVPANVMCALGAPETDEPDPAQYGQLGQTDFVVLHMDRGRDKWNMVRRVKELGTGSENFKRPVLNNEMIGAADSPINGKRESDPAIYYTAGVLNRLFEVGGCFHSDSGLQGEQRTEHQEACAQAFLTGSNLIKTNAKMVFKNAGWADSPVKSAAFDSGVVRTYSGLAEDGSENVVVLVGLTGDPRMEMQNGWKLGEVLGEMPGVRVHRLVR